MNYYILNGKRPVEVNDVLIWSKWFETANRHVRKSEIGEYLVSTVFLRIDHSFSETASPLLFETMIFGPAESAINEYQTRATSWDEAELQHAQAVREVLRYINTKKVSNGS